MVPLPCLRPAIGAPQPLCELLGSGIILLGSGFFIIAIVIMILFIMN